MISNIRVTEMQDTSVLLTGSEFITSAKINSLLSGDTTYATGANLVLKTFYDSLSKTIKTQATVKPKTISFKYHKITEKQESQTNSVASTKQDEQKQSIQALNKDKEITRSSLPWWLILLIGVIVLSIIGWAVLKLKHFKP